jgi:hypothetical protein
VKSILFCIAAFPFDGANGQSICSDEQTQNMSNSKAHCGEEGTE